MLSRDITTVTPTALYRPINRLDTNNVQEAIEISGAKQVDVSSGVESSPGIKDTKLIYKFVNTVREKNYGR